MEGRVGSHDAVVGHEQRVAVGWRFGGSFSGNDAVGAGAVVNQHALACLLGDLRGDGPGNGVNSTASAKGDDEFDGPVWKRLRGSRKRCAQQGHGQQGQCDGSSSVKSHA